MVKINIDNVPTVYTLHSARGVEFAFIPEKTLGKATTLIPVAVADYMPNPLILHVEKDHVLVLGGKEYVVSKVTRCSNGKEVFVEALKP